MELISYRNIIHEIVKPFEFVENTRKFLPHNISFSFGLSNVSSMFEFDKETIALLSTSFAQALHSFPIETRYPLQ